MAAGLAETVGVGGSALVQPPTADHEELFAAIDQLPGILPALQAWIDHAARWERDRRNGLDYPLQGPMAAISPDELPDALAASALIAECFRAERRRDVAAVLAFFEGLRETLLAERQREGSALH